ncbi:MULTISPECIES: DUF397 domain-containing protein [Streptomyces]|uniref:DUF397 domain-containing protein n=1 Tax=Streptomyces venezuelae TaxID=54571 RepID=A0A5P2BB28_STRVZ|nr:DUF397 domain-containing protein [Streptomyces venezuelae]MYY83084.1 DUF397 domain-containing protein [Streptomyces sp. SID335]MYZ12266.1 DUF397 domain-containing protein [Streptomyces sp. SID337]NDZ84322.1 DUF397 domain-containing protein [Streptomyces sp. SID10115]NEA00927.1 DUF397 domain-containing protein [Streptomyces sp. SID10116]NEB49200.1 DUF397 domain-containing protein [Streptomyces sp. SID339]
MRLDPYAVGHPQIPGLHLADCLEIAHTATGGLAVHDSKDPKGSTLSFPEEAGNSFVTGLKSARSE